MIIVGSELTKLPNLPLLFTSPICFIFIHIIHIQGYLY